jgi:hypothetical protein
MFTLTDLGLTITIPRYVGTRPIVRTIHGATYPHSKPEHRFGHYLWLGNPDEGSIYDIKWRKHET